MVHLNKSHVWVGIKKIAKMKIKNRLNLLDLFSMIDLK